MDVKGFREGVDHLIAAMASRQHGVVSRVQLLEAGASRDELVFRIRAGHLIPVHRGVYLVGHRAETPRARDVAALLACGDRAVVSHGSAARLWDLPPYCPRLPIHVTIPPERSVTRPGIRVHRSPLSAGEVRVVDGIRVTSPARTILDQAALVSRAELEDVVAQALRGRKRLLSLGDLQVQLDRRPHRPGTGPLRRLLERQTAPAFTRSKAERKLLVLVRRAGLPEPETNVEVCGFEVDFLWRRKRVIVEFDGAAFHSDYVSFERDRERANELQLHGYTVLRVTWSALTKQSGGVSSRIHRALQAGAPVR
jgi:very-short-patch-repair endonuclease